MVDNRQMFELFCQVVQNMFDEVTYYYNITGYGYGDRLFKIIFRTSVGDWLVYPEFKYNRELPDYVILNYIGDSSESDKRNRLVYDSMPWWWGVHTIFDTKDLKKQFIVDINVCLDVKALSKVKILLNNAQAFGVADRKMCYHFFNYGEVKMAKSDFYKHKVINLSGRY